MWLVLNINGVNMASLALGPSYETGLNMDKIKLFQLLYGTQN